MALSSRRGIHFMERAWAEAREGDTKRKSARGFKTWSRLQSGG